MCGGVIHITVPIQIHHTVGAGGGRTGELYSVGKLDRGKVGDRFVDFPCEAVGGTVVLYLEAVITLILVAAEVGHISILLILQFLPANGETKRAGNEIETLADSIRHSGTLINSVEDFMLD